MKKICVISGSPHKKGDTSQLTQLIENHILQYTDKDSVLFQSIFLKDKKIEFCRGCLVCMKKGEHRCPLKDDAHEVISEVLGADAILFVSPVYVHTISGIMKNFFDRFAYLMHRPPFQQKPALIITSTELSGHRETVQYLRFVSLTWDLNLIGDISIIADAFYEPGKFRDATLEKIKLKSKQFVQALFSEQVQPPSIASLQFFHKLKTKINLHKEKLPYDYQYWQNKGWLEQEYFYPVKINLIKKIIGKLPIRIIMIVMRIKLGKAVFQKLVKEPLTNNGGSYAK